MTTRAPETPRHQLDRWLEQVNHLVAQVTAWAEIQGWSTHRDQKIIEERRLGRYSVPTLRIRLAQGEIHVNPIARGVMGAEGRVDVEAWPSLNRVRLLPSGDQWRIVTDSNVPLNSLWGADTFAQLIKDLTAGS